MKDSQTSMPEQNLKRHLGLVGLIATGICSMLGASINVVPFMIQRNVPGIGPYVLFAFGFAALPALLAAFAYASLARAMPRAGGSYIYASRGLSPYLGFVASFSQWFGLSIVIGVVAYITIPFLRDIALGLELEALAKSLDEPLLRTVLALALVWLFVGINIRGTRLYEKTLIPLMILMFAMGGLVIGAGFFYTENDFLEALKAGGTSYTPESSLPAFDWKIFLSAAALLFSSFIGFDSIAQAGGEAKNPSKTIPLAIGLTILIVGLYYILFAGMVYRIVPWDFIAQEAQSKDISAPGLLGYVLPGYLAILIIAAAAIALINDLPAMLLSVSRLMFAWAEDGIFPKFVTKIHPLHSTPHIAIYLSGVMASLGVLGSQFAGDFFLGIDIMVTAMMVNFLLMCLSLFFIFKRNPALAAGVKGKGNPLRFKIIALAGTLVMAFFLIIHTMKDFNQKVEAWYFHSTPTYLIVMALGSLIFFTQYRKLKRTGVNTRELFKNLP